VRRVPVLFALFALLLGGCLEGSRVPGAMPACDTREGPLLGCGARTGGPPLDSIRAACQKLAECGLVSIEGGARSFQDCINDFEGYPIDALPAILECIGRTDCQSLRDPANRGSGVSICERFGS